MKKISIVFFAAVFSFSCNQKKETASAYNDLFKDNLKGSIQQITETPYQTDSTGKMGAMDSCCINIIQYDSAGYLTKVVDKDSKGNIKFEQSSTHYDNGLFKEFSNLENGKMSDKITMQLDKDGKKYLSAQVYDSAGKLKSFYKDMTQNEYINVTSEKQYKPDSTLKKSFEYKYDKQIFVGQTTIDSSGKEISKTLAKLDDKGNEIEITLTSTMKDDKTKKDSATTKVNKYKYDSYDEQGNWTQRTNMDGKGKPTKIVKREITYYKK